MNNLQDLTNTQLMDATALMLMQRQANRSPILTDSYFEYQEDFTLLEDRRLFACAADGGCLGYNPSPVGGMWAFCVVDDTDTRVFEAGGIVVSETEYERVRRDMPHLIPPPYIKYDFVSNNITELLALMLAIETLPDNFHGAVMTDSNITRGRLFFDWAWENVRYELRQRAEAAVEKHGGKVNLFPILLAGHPSEAELATGRSTKRNLPVSVHNKWCDDYCKAIAAWYMTTYQVPPLPPRPRRIPQDQVSADQIGAEGLESESIVSASPGTKEMVYG